MSVPECPQDHCGNEEMDAVEDDPDADYFCHWCGGLFTDDEVGPYDTDTDQSGGGA